MTSSEADPSTRETLDAEDLWARSSATGEMLGSPVDYLNEIEAVLAASPPGALRTARSFFSRMDARTESALSAVTLSGAELTTMRMARSGALLAVTKHFAQRFEAGGSGPQIGPFRTDVRTISGVLRGLVEEHFPAYSPNDFDLAQAEDAFERFANGELRLWLPEAGAWTTQPSSGFYFFFAEFAFVALELDVDTELWEPLLGSLVRTQRIFASVYAPLLPEATQADYHPRHFDEKRMWSKSQKEDLGVEFRRLNGAALSRAATANARAAFPGFGQG